MGELVRGLGDPEVKAIVLSEVEQKTDLSELICLIQAKEYGRSSSSTPAISAIFPSGKKKCPNCGSHHEKGTSWKEHCPAQKKNCNKCGKIGHFASVCRSKGRNKTNAVEEDETRQEEENNAIETGFDYVFMLEAATKKFEKKQRQKTSKQKQNTLASIKTLPHFVWRNENWTIKPARKAPMVKIKYKLCPDGLSTCRRTIP